MPTITNEKGKKVIVSQKEFEQRMELRRQADAKIEEFAILKGKALRAGYSIKDEKGPNAFHGQEVYLTKEELEPIEVDGVVHYGGQCHGVHIRNGYGGWQCYQSVKPIGWCDLPKAGWGSAAGPFSD